MPVSVIIAIKYIYHFTWMAIGIDFDHLDGAVPPICLSRAQGSICTLNSAVETVFQRQGYPHRVCADIHNRLRIHGAIPVSNRTMVLQTSTPVDVAIRSEFPHKRRTRTNGWSW